MSLTLPYTVIARSRVLACGWDVAISERDAPHSQGVNLAFPHPGGVGMTDGNELAGQDTRVACKEFGKVITSIKGGKCICET